MNSYATVNAVMGRPSDWRDNSTHMGKAAMRLSWEVNSTHAEKVLEERRDALLALPAVQKVWLSRESEAGWPRKLCVKVDPAKL